MSTDLTIREAMPAEAATVIGLYERAGIDADGDNDRSAAPALLERVQAAGGRVLVAEQGGPLVGTLTLFILPLMAHRGRPEALVEDVAVDPTAQGVGVGRALMHEAMRRARAAGCYKLALTSNVKRVAAHDFYDHLGFQRHGISFVVALDDPQGPAA